MTPLDQLRLRLPDHDFDRVMQAAKHIASPERDAFLKDIAAELGKHEVVGPDLPASDHQPSAAAQWFRWSAPLNEVRRRVDAMPLSPEQEAVCERLAKGESEPLAAVLIRQQAREIDDLWDRLSHAYALVRRESPAEMIQEEMQALRAMLEERRQLQTSG
jgi:hypothetical protein